MKQTSADNKKSEGQIIFSLRLTLEDKKALEEAAKRHDRSEASMVRYLIRKYLLKKQ
jgi:predicted DNA-binding protein